MIGGVVRMFMDRRKNVDEETKTKQTTDGTLYCAGTVSYTHLTLPTTQTV